MKKDGRGAERKEKRRRRRGEEEQSRAEGGENGKNKALARINSSQLLPSRTAAYDLATCRRLGRRLLIFPIAGFRVCDF